MIRNMTVLFNEIKQTTYRCIPVFDPEHNGFAGEQRIDKRFVILPQTVGAQRAGFPLSKPSTCMQLDEFLEHIVGLNSCFCPLYRSRAELILKRTHTSANLVPCVMAKRCQYIFVWSYYFIVKI